jgi:hypothetical protein
MAQQSIFKGINMPTIIDGSGSATFQTPLPLAQGGSGNTTGNVVSSQVADAFNATGSAPLYACRAWVNFNGTGTVAIRASGNVSSITDNGTGNYTINFATAMPDANFAANASGSLDQEIRVDGYVNSAVRVVTDSTVTDSATVSVAIFR